MHPNIPQTGIPRISTRARRALASLATLLAASAGFAEVTTTGYQNVARPEAPGTLLSHPKENDSWKIGRTTVINYFRGWVIVGPEAPESAPNSDNFVRIYDISNPYNPSRRLPSHFGLDYPDDAWNTRDNKGKFSYGWNAHGSVQSSDTFLYPAFVVANGFGSPISKGAGAATYPISFNRSGMAGPWTATMQWYDKTDSMFSLGKAYNISGNTYTNVTHGTFDHVGRFGGGDWHPIFFGDLLIYARSDSTSTSTITGRDGVVVYRIAYENFESSTLSERVMRPEFVASLSTGFGAYWPNLFSEGSRLYVVGGSQNRVQVADITNAVDPTLDPSISLVVNYTTPLSHAPYPMYQDNFAFIHHKKFDMNRLIARNANPIVLELDQNTRLAANDPTPGAPAKTTQSIGVDTSQMSLPLGNLWLTGGFASTDRSQGLGVWVHQQEPDTTKPTVAYHIPQRFRQNYPRFAPLSFLIHEVPRNGTVRPGIDFTVRPVLAGGTLGAHVPGLALHDMGGVLTYTPDQPLAANTTYQVDFLSSDNGTPNNLNDDIGFIDAAGNRMDAYNFTFSTGGLTPPPAPVINSVTAGNYQPAAGATTTVGVNAQGTGLTYRFNINGTWTDWGTTSTTNVSFASPGRYRVSVQVKNSDGVISTSFVNILVPAGNALANAPTSSSAMAIGQDTAGRRLWVVNPDSDTVSVLNASSGAKIGEYKVGKNPRSIARDSNGRYWVTVMGEDKIVILNQDGTIQQTVGGGNSIIPYGAAPFGIAPNQDGSVMFVSYYGLGRLARFTVPTGTGTVSAPVVSSANQAVPTARAIAVRYDPTAPANQVTRVFVTRFISGESVGEVHEFNGASGTLARTQIINVSFLSNVADSGDNGAGVPNYLAGIAISPDGKYALVSGKKDNVRRGLLFSPLPVPNTPNPVGDLAPANTVRAMLAVIDLSSNSETTAARRDFDNSDSPVGIAFSGRGDTAFIALQGNNQVAAIDSIDLTASGGSALLTARIGTGLAPQSVLYDSTSKRLYVQNFMNRTVSVLNATDFQDLNQSSFGSVATTSTVATELLSSTQLLGKQIFYNASDTRMSAEGYISCATCHVDGGHDGRVWDFTGRGEGLRRTTDLRGRGGLNHGNVHWTANFDEIEDFEHDIRKAFGGSGFLPLNADEFNTQYPDASYSIKNATGAAPLNALAAYVSSLGTSSVPRSPFRQATGAFTTTTGSNAVAGKRLFEGLDATPALTCATCHAGKAFTDSIVAPVTGALLDDVGTLTVPSGSRRNGTLTGIDVPSLLGVHASRVYLHHGFAGTLDDVFTYAGGNSYEAEDATKVFSYRPPTNRISGYTSLDQRAGGGGQISGLFGGKGVLLITDTEDLNGNKALDTGEDTNGNGQLDVNPSHTAIQFTNIDGGAGGNATLRIRYASAACNLAIKVNGTALPNASLPVSNGVGWFNQAITLNAGTSNTIELRRVGTDITIDCIIVSNVANLAAASAHRQVLGLTSDQRNNLLAYLRQIDGRDENGKLEVLSNLVARYAFETSTLGTDSAGAATVKNGTVYGAGILQTTSDVGSGTGASSWNGNSANRIEVADHNDLDGGSKFSISVRIKPNAVGVDGNPRAILSKRTGVNTNMAYSLFLHTGGKLNIDISGSSRFATTNAIPTNQWTHIALVYDGTLPQAERVKLYVNGVLETTVSNSTTTLAATTAPLHIGTLNANYTYSYSGLIDDIRLYKDAALTSDEVSIIKDSAQ